MALSNCCFKAQGKSSYSKFIYYLHLSQTQKNQQYYISFCLVCAKGWKDINGKCFLLSTDLNDIAYQLTYEEAVETCYYKGGRLYEPRDKNIKQFVLEVSITLRELPIIMS